MKTPADAIKFKPSVPDSENYHTIEKMSNKSAFDYFRDEKIYSGINIGNTLDAYNRGKANETVWGNPRINQQLMDGIKAAGFDIVRIPVTWMGYIGSEPDYHIDNSYLKRIADVVTMAHDAGLKVIINMHHDGSTSATSEEGWLSVKTAVINTDEYNRITIKFVRIWKQIALYFKNYGDWLMFEPMNEIHDGNWGAGNFLVGQFLVVNNWNQIFTTAVRSTGVNNEKRYLVFPGYCTNIRHTLAGYFILPTDPSPDKQVVTFHYYDPYQFGIEGTRTEWGSDADKQKVINDFSPFMGKFIDNKIPVIIGECGAVLQLYPNDTVKEAQARQSRLDYIPYVYAAAKRYGLVPIYWDNGLISGNGEKFGLFDRRTGLPNSADSENIIKLMINAVQ
ncbi:MAG: glycoside hydrolase family 5 protein [Treponema sp.]|nr:glycoside hydrolase family 5 protein [Treponema sp.]